MEFDLFSIVVEVIAGHCGMVKRFYVHSKCIPLECVVRDGTVVALSNMDIPGISSDGIVFHGKIIAFIDGDLHLTV